MALIGTLTEWTPNSLTNSPKKAKELGEVGEAGHQ